MNILPPARSTRMKRSTCIRVLNGSEGEAKNRRHIHFPVMEYDPRKLLLLLLSDAKDSLEQVNVDVSQSSFIKRHTRAERGSAVAADADLIGDRKVRSARVLAAAHPTFPTPCSLHSRPLAMANEQVPTRLKAKTSPRNAIAEQKRKKA